MPSRKAQKEAAALAAAMKQAEEDAQKLYKQHEKDRRNLEALDKADRDNELFQKALEDERLARERKAYADVESRTKAQERLIFLEHDKHSQWESVKHASWLPSVNSESEINTFLSSWREEQEIAAGGQDGEVTVQMKCTLQPQRQISIDHMNLVRQDEGPTSKLRQKSLSRDLQMCSLAHQLTKEIWREVDSATVSSDSSKLSFHRRSLQDVYQQIMATLDGMTTTTLMYMDIFIGDEEYFLKAEETIKFGVWVKAIGASNIRSGGMHYQSPVNIAIDPKDSTTSRLPRGIYRDGQSLRAIQLHFDPYSISVNQNEGQEYYALDCVIIVELLAYQERAKRMTNMDFLYRTDTAAHHTLNKLDYPPRDNKGDDHTIKVTFDVPERVVIRHRTPLIGKWNEQYKRWDPCGTSNYMYDPTIRKTSFLTSDLTSMAIIQEKGFDVPYEQWQLAPLTSDQVLFVLEGRRRGEASDREVKILAKDHLCKLLAPEERELSFMRENWLPPATLLRLLACAGYNFLLNDVDAEFIPSVLPKSKAVEDKGYYDIAQFCTLHAFASTRHNKAGEDVDMGLMRISRSQRAAESDEPFVLDVDDDDVWHSIRYEKDRCVVAKFKDSDEEPDLSNMTNQETHLNLYTTLEAEYGTSVAQHTQNSNKLLQRSIFELLSLTRPFTWG